MYKQQAIEFLDRLVDKIVYLVDKDQLEEYEDDEDTVLFHLPDVFDEDFIKAFKLTIEQDKYELCSWRQMYLPDGECFILYIRRIGVQDE